MMDDAEMGQSLEAAIEEMYRAGYTDGLPVIPPTPERVESMVRASGHGANEVVAALDPAMAEATVEKVAVNAVMAGCLPEHLPVVIAALQAISRDDFNLLGVQSTTGSAAVAFIVNGPLRRRLEMNAGGNALGPGNRANAAIGRAISLVLRNIGGALPGEIDMATLGQPGKYGLCFPENEEESPWEPLHVARGYSPQESAVTAVGTAGYIEIVDILNSDGEDILNTVAGAMTQPGMAGQDGADADVSPLVVLAPEHARHIGRRFSRSEAQAYLWEQATVPVDRLHPPVAEMVMDRRQRQGRLDARAPIHPCARPEDIVLVVAGGIGQKSAYLPAWYGGTQAQTQVIQS